MGHKKYNVTPTRQSPRIAEREAPIIEMKNSVTSMIYPALKGFCVSCKFLRNILETLQEQFNIKGQRSLFSDRWITNFKKELQFTTGEKFDSGDKVKKVCVIVINYVPKMLLHVISIEGGGCKTVLTEYNQVCLRFRKLDSSAAVSEDLFKVITHTSTNEPKPSTSKTNKSVKAEIDQIPNAGKKSRDDVRGSNISCCPQREDKKETAALKNANHPVPTLWDEPMDVDELNLFNEGESAFPTGVYSDLLKDLMDFVNDELEANRYAAFSPFECNDLDWDPKALFPDYPDTALNTVDSEKRTVKTQTLESRINAAAEASNGTASVSAGNINRNDFGENSVNGDSFAPTQQDQASREPDPNSFQNSCGEDSLSMTDKEFRAMDDYQDKDCGWNLSCHGRMHSRPFRLWDIKPLGRRQQIRRDRFSTD